MKQVIFKRDDGYYMTSQKNYSSYVQDVRAIKKLHGVNTMDDVVEFIDKACVWYGDKPENYSVVW